MTRQLLNFPPLTLNLTPANRHLIAAAPDLLEALYSALPLIEDAAEFMKDDFKPGYLIGLVKKVEAAIDKAEGRD